MRYGLIPRVHDSRDYAFKTPEIRSTSFIDLSKQFPEQPWNQGNLGSCVAHGGAACVDFARVRSGLKPLRRPSRLFLYYTARVRAGYPINEDTGLQIRDVFKAVAKDGAPPEKDWYYEVSRFAEKPPAKAYEDASHDLAVAYGLVHENDVDNVIRSTYPVAFGFTVYESFESAETLRTGIVPIPDKSRERVLGGHCMVFVSTVIDGSLIGGVPGVLYRKARNSWGTECGDPKSPGHVWFPISETDTSDMWAITAMGDPAIVETVENLLDQAREDSSIAVFMCQPHRGVQARVAELLRKLFTAR